ncbi:MAG: hypothetical protein JNM56_16990 [Planctomycetia bacterium]|nr:hypothetical protein [Planctomycetia bacterium]
MSRTKASRWLLAGALLAVTAVVGCEAEPPPVKPVEPPKETATIAPAKRQKVGKNVYLETPDNGPRRVVVNSYVCLREGQLEGFLTRRQAKEHEYILASDCDAQIIHAALIAAGAEAGSPVRFGPGDQYTAAHGTTIKVSVQYRDKAGKLVTMPAQQWIRNAVKKNAFDHQWVFAGSRVIPDPDQKLPPFYGANSGDLICICNMPEAMLDLPIKNPNSEPDTRIFEAWTERIPPMGTRVDVILEPVLDKKPAKIDEQPEPTSDKQ